MLNLNCFVASIINAIFSTEWSFTQNKATAGQPQVALKNYQYNYNTKLIALSAANSLMGVHHD